MLTASNVLSLDNGCFDFLGIDLCPHAVPDFEEWKSETVPNDVLFDYYTHQESEENEKEVSAPTIIVERAAKHLASYIDAQPEDMFSHLCNLYNMFQMDEEIFLTAVITLYRYMGALGPKLVLSNASELFYLLVLCLLISLKGIMDHPLDLGSVAREFGLDASRLAFNEHQILVSLKYSLFFKPSDLFLTDDEVELEKEEMAGTIPRRNHRRGSIIDILPLEGLLCLSYSSQKPRLPAAMIEWKHLSVPEYEYNKQMMLQRQSETETETSEDSFETDSEEEFDSEYDSEDDSTISESQIDSIESDTQFDNISTESTTETIVSTESTSDNQQIIPYASANTYSESENTSVEALKNTEMIIKRAPYIKRLYELTPPTQQYEFDSLKWLLQYVRPDKLIGLLLSHSKTIPVDIMLLACTYFVSMGEQSNMKKQNGKSQVEEINDNESTEENTEQKSENISTTESFDELGNKNTEQNIDTLALSQNIKLFTQKKPQRNNAKSSKRKTTKEIQQQSIVPVSSHKTTDSPLASKTPSRYSFPTTPTISLFLLLCLAYLASSGNQSLF